MNGQGIRPFLFEGENLIRVIERAGDPWFVAADVCRVNGIKNTAQAVETLDADEKGICSTYTLGGDQQLLIVSEGGLFTLMLRSRQATTPGTVQHRFRKWVTAEVLPAIRRTGRYEPERPEPLPDDGEQPEPDTVKLRKVNTAIRAFGERAGAQLWIKLGLDWVPAMAAAMGQGELFPDPPPSAPMAGRMH